MTSCVQVWLYSVGRVWYGDNVRLCARHSRRTSSHFLPAAVVTNTQHIPHRPKDQDLAPRSTVHHSDRTTPSSASQRDNVYELEAELQRMKEQNQEAMGALENARKQIHRLEQELKG